MKHIFIGMLAFSLAACSNSNKSAKNDELRVMLGDSIDAQGVQRMQVSNVEDHFNLSGREYVFTVHRMPADSLPRIKDETGNLFVDNVITLRIIRGTEQLFKRTFTKQSFASLVPENFLRHSILEGMVFDKTTDKGVVFAVSVSYPQSDLYFPIALTITADGTMSMEKVDMMEDGSEF